MNFATLLLAPPLRQALSEGLHSMGIEVLHCSEFKTLVANLDSESFEAILAIDDAQQLGQWVRLLQANAARPFAMLVVGAGGASAISRALLQGADDYIVIDESAERIVHRLIARASSKIQRPNLTMWRLGPFTLDGSKRTLSSTVATVRVSPRELILARALLENHGKVVSSDILSQELNGRSDETGRRALKQVAHTLRMKCREAAGSSIRCLTLESIYGQGYRLTQ